MINRACFVPAPFSGHYEPLLECGEQVREADLSALLHNFEHLELEPTPIRAGVSGIITV